MRPFRAASLSKNALERVCQCSTFIELFFAFMITKRQTERVIHLNKLWSKHQEIRSTTLRVSGLQPSGPRVRSQYTMRIEVHGNPF